MRLAQRFTWSRFVIAALLVSSLPFIPAQMEKAHAVSTCSASNFSITPNYNPTFYQVSASISSTYVEYIIKNVANGSGHYYAKIDNFSAGVVSKATNEDPNRDLGTLANGDSASVFWYLTSSNKSTSPQTHDVTIYSDSGYTTPVCKVNSGFTSVDRTIAANANKLTSVVNDALPAVGSTFNVTVKGQTGTIGAGPTGDSDVNLTPATDNSFPANKYQLVNLSYLCGGVTITGKLWVKNACQGNYTATFTFKYLTSSGSSAPTSPVMQIASGANMKHTSTPSFTITPIGAAPLPYTLTTGPGSVTTTSATLYGLSYNGIASAKFCYVKSNSTVTSFSSCTNATAAASGSEAAGWSIGITGLTSGTYYYEIWGYTGAGLTGTLYKGGVVSWVAPTSGISELTDTATAVTGTSATLNGHQVANTSGLTVSCQFTYSTTNPTSGHFDPLNDPMVNATASGSPPTYSLNVSNLTINITYYFEMICSDSNGSIYYYGGVKSFTTTNPTLYTLYFDATTGFNYDGSETITVNSVPAGSDGLSSSYKPSPNPTQSGKVFLGWTKDGTTVITSDTVSANTTYFAKWDVAAAYVISYDALGSYWSTGQSIETQTLNTGDDAIALQPSFTLSRTNYEFHGWSETSGGTTQVTSYSVSGTKTFYAIWLPEITITWDANLGLFGANTSETSTVVSGDDAFTANPTNDPTRSGYTFLGYAEASTDTTTVTTYIISTAKTFYAVWTPTVYSYTVIFNNNGGSGTLANLTAGTPTNLRTNTFTRSGYTFGGWATSSGSTTVAYTDGQQYPFNANITLYAIWNAVAGPAPAAPPPPVVSLSAGKEVCAKGVTLVIDGQNLLNATVTFDGTPAQVASSTNTQLLVVLPPGGIGNKTLKVFNSGGQALTTIKYVLVDDPVYYNFLYPETYKGSPFTYTFAATNAYGYAVEGTLPAGLSLNGATGELYGTPTVEGNYKFTLVALNPCGNSYLDVYMLVDRPIPPNYTCTVAFNVPGSNNINAIKAENFKTCLSKVLALAPATIDPIIYLSGGVPAGLSIDQQAAHPRYVNIVSLIDSLNTAAQIYIGAFAGPLDEVQAMIYWPVS